MPKSKKELDNEYYQQNKEHKKAQRRIRYQEQKELAEKQKKEMEHSLYTAESIKILMTWGEFTNFSKEKKKQWAEFMWTLKEIADNILFADVTQLQKLELLTSNIVRDYHETAKTFERKLVTDWTILNAAEQNKLVKRWGRERAREKKALDDKIEEFVKQGESHEKDIELMKFHEERGKVKCDCWKCQEEKKIRGEIKDEQRGKEPKEKIECSECKKMVSLSSWNEDEGACKPCVKRLNG